MVINKSDLWFSIAKMQRIISVDIEQRLTAAGMPNYTFCDALRAIESGPGGRRRMHELANVLAIQRYTLTRLVDRLEKDKLVIRIRSAENYRAVDVAITEKGKALCKDMWLIYSNAIDEAFLSYFGTEVKLELIAEAIDRIGEVTRAAQTRDKTQ